MVESVSLETAITQLVTDVLAPLLRADGSDIALVSIEADAGRVTLSLSGDAHVGPGAQYVKDEIIAPAIERAAGRPLEVRYEALIPLLTAARES